MTLAGWQPLSCDCGNDCFQQAFKLTWHESQGMTSVPFGWTCIGCGKRSDTAKMINVAKRQNAAAKIAELQAEVGNV